MLKSRYKHFISFVLTAFMIILFLSGSVLAENDTIFTHTANYNIGGKIDINRNIGHACFTGAEKKQNISGYGEMKKTESVTIASNIMRVEETTDWTASAASALHNLTVSTTIDLCAVPMHELTSTDYVYSTVDGNWYALDSKTTTPSFKEVYQNIDNPTNTLYDAVKEAMMNADGLTAKEADQKLLGLSKAELEDLAAKYLADTGFTLQDYTPLTRQIWSTRITADAGETGSYHADFQAAYGPGPRQVGGVKGPYGGLVSYERDYMWWFDDLAEDGIGKGDYYVGNYFEIDQYAYTSGGSMRRFIDISSPFSLALFKEDMLVTGMAEVKEAFNMDNLEPGPEAIRLVWWELLF